MKVGITGGIGSGKTTVCKLFEALGIPVYYADDRAKEIMVSDPGVIGQVTALLGNEAYFPDGRLNRAYISGVVFAEPAKLEALNRIVHPAVWQDGEAWHEAQTEVPYTLKEAALLIESGGHKRLDRLILVTAPVELRLNRVMQRDKTTREAVVARMEKQLPDEEKSKYADFLIRNDGDSPLADQVEKIHGHLLEEAVRKGVAIKNAGPSPNFE